MLSRRSFVKTSATAALGGAILPASHEPHGSRTAYTQPTTPDEALARLVDGNARYVAKQLTSFHDDLDILKQNTVDKQEPFAAVLSCADSRVPVELIFDQTIGHVFVTRVAGNIATSEIIASLEYGVAVLGTKLIMVMGHGACGAVKAAISAKAVPGQISSLYRYIRPAVDQGGTDVDSVTRANAVIQARLLRESSPVVADAIKQNALRVVASVYDLASGKVTLLS